MKTIQFDFTTNLGGIRKIFALPEGSIKKIWENAATGTATLEAVHRENIMEIYTTEDTAGFSEESKRTASGTAYEIEISGITPKSNPVNRENLIRLESGYWFVLFEDNNGYIRLAGNPDSLLYFEKKETTGSELKNRNQISFAFHGMQSSPCLYIDLEDIEDI